MSLHAEQSRRSRRVVWRLAPGQLISWGTLYYAITFLAKPVHDDTGWEVPQIFAAYGAGLLAAAVSAPRVGRFLAEGGGRVAMSRGSLLGGVSLLSLAAAPNLWVFAAAWLLAGVAMSLTLYEAAFTTLHESGATEFRRNMTTLTLIGGFASTLFWPLSFWLEVLLGWRVTLGVFAAMHLFVCFPLHRALPELGGSRPGKAPEPPTESAHARLVRLPAFWSLAMTWVLLTLVSATLSAHAGILLSARGVETSTILVAVSLFGPMQVVGRLVDLRFGERWSVRTLGLAGSLLVLVGVGVLLTPLEAHRAAFVFAAFYGLGNGVLTLVKGMAPAQVLGTVAYGSALGWVSAPALVARALAPSGAAFVMQSAGAATLLATLVTVLLAATALFSLAYQLAPAPSLARSSAGRAARRS